MEDFAEFFIKGLGAVAIIFLVLFMLTLPTYWLWNWLMPLLFGLKTITFWQAFGINILCNILFKSTGK